MQDIVTRLRMVRGGAERLAGWVTGWVTRKRLALGTLGLAGAFLGAQGLTIAIVRALAARRKQHTGVPESGFPRLTLAPVREGENELQIYTYGQDLYDAMLRAIDAAQETIYLETFIWKDDRIGRQFKQRLARKAAEGVEVYVVFDGFANLVVPRAFLRFPPPVHALRYWFIARPWQALDPRRYALDHRKLLVVDGRIGFLGGYNIGDAYATRWRDTHVGVRGPAAADMAQSFVYFWNRFCPRAERIHRRHARRLDPCVSFWSTSARRLSFPIRDMYLRAIDRAEHRIFLTQAYFLPDRNLLKALKRAARRGVDVRLLVPWVSNHAVADWIARGTFAGCLRAGIRVFGYRSAILHAKTGTVDGEWSTIGTANLDRLSLLGNYELNAEIYNRELARQMEAIFHRDTEGAVELTLRDWQNRPQAARLAEEIVSPLRVLL